MVGFKKMRYLYLHKYKVIKLGHFFINSHRISDGMQVFDDEMKK
jgi:hypothetical protein